MAVKGSKSIARSKNDDLALLDELMASGKLKPVIEKRYTLNEVPAAIRDLEEGKTRGKLLVTIGHGNAAEIQSAGAVTA